MASSLAPSSQSSVFQLDTLKERLCRLTLLQIHAAETPFSTITVLPEVEHNYNNTIYLMRFSATFVTPIFLRTDLIAPALTPLTTVKDNDDGPLPQQWNFLSTASSVSVFSEANHVWAQELPLLCAYDWVVTPLSAILFQLRFRSRVDVSPVRINPLLYLLCYPSAEEITDTCTIVHAHEDTGAVTKENFSLSKSSQCRGGNYIDLLHYLSRRGLSEVSTRYTSRIALTEMSSLLNSPISPLSTFLGDTCSSSVTGVLAPSHILATSCPDVESTIISTPYSVTDVMTTTLVNLTSYEKMLHFREDLARCLRRDGPMLVGVHVFSDFLTKTFVSENNPFGMYVPSSQAVFLGTHVMTLVGYGSYPIHDSLLDPHTDWSGVRDSKGFVTLECWLLQNSWSDKWNTEGYVPFLMYPWNSRCAIEVLYTLEFSHRRVSKSGGITLFRAHAHESFSHSKFEPFHPPNPSSTRSPSQFLWVFGICVCILLIYAAVIIFKNYSVKRNV